MVSTVRHSFVLHDVTERGNQGLRRPNFVSTPENPMVNRSAKFINCRFLAIRNLLSILGIYRRHCDDNKETVGTRNPHQTPYSEHSSMTPSPAHRLPTSSHTRRATFIPCFKVRKSSMGFSLGSTGIGGPPTFPSLLDSIPK